MYVRTAAGIGLLFDLRGSGLRLMTGLGPVASGEGAGNALPYYGAIRSVTGRVAAARCRAVLAKFGKPLLLVSSAGPGGSDWLAPP